MEDKLISILEELGYTFRKTGHYYQCRAIYRDGSDETSVVIYPANNFFKDFVSGECGPIQKLIALTLKCDLSKVNDFLKERGISGEQLRTQTSKPVIKAKIFPADLLKDLIPIHDYWTNKGIRLSVVQLFEGGIDINGKMKGRYVFPIFDEHKRIIGVIGRDTYAPMPNRPKYKIVGNKVDFCWPLHLNKGDILNKKQVILVESPHCVLKLWDIDVKHTLCLFGTEISATQLNMLLRLDPNTIVIALNNEPDNKNIGNIAAGKLANKLCKYFDARQIYIALPFKKDFGEQTREENLQWYELILKEVV